MLLIWACFSKFPEAETFDWDNLCDVVALSVKFVSGCVVTGVCKIRPESIETGPVASDPGSWS